MRAPKLKSRYVCSAIRVKLLDGRFKKTQYPECENPVSYKRKTRVREATQASVLKDPMNSKMPTGGSAILQIKEPARCRWDLLSLGEVMLRLDPGDVRVSTAREFRAWEGGGEYNVARGLRRCFGLRTSV